MKTFSFDDIGIAKIFVDFSLIIPPHQRDYAWTEDQVEQRLCCTNRVMAEVALLPVRAIPQLQ